MKIRFLVKRNLSKPDTPLDPGCYWDQALWQGWGSSCKPSRVGQDPTHLCWPDIFLEYLPLEALVFPLCERLVLFHLKGKTGHKLLRNFMGLSKAQIGSQGKIKLQLLYGKLNGKERLLPQKREPCLREWRGWGDFSESTETPLVEPLKSLWVFWASSWWTWGLTLGVILVGGRTVWEVGGKKDCFL